MCRHRPQGYLGIAGDAGQWGVLPQNRHGGDDLRNPCVFGELDAVITPVDAVALHTVFFGTVPAR